jgi:hypothetical protein
MSMPGESMLTEVITHHMNLTHIPPRLVGELAQLSRHATPAPRSLSTTPNPEASTSAHKSENSRVHIEQRPR